MDFKEALASVNEKFKVYKGLVDGVGFRKINHLIVSGEPGIGKSYEAEELLSAHAQVKRARVCKSSGHMTPLALYNHLFKYRNETDINLFDDCDSVFKVAHTLNLLKAATDTIPERYITWESTSTKVAATSFNFKGSVVLLTNVDMHAKIDMYRPLLDRVHYYRLELSPEEKVARIISVLFKKGKGQQGLDDVAGWLIANYERFGRFLSIRTAVKMIQLAAMSKDWKRIVEETMIPPEDEQGGADVKEL